jgi:hypothetical protein
LRIASVYKDAYALPKAASPSVDGLDGGTEITVLRQKG